ncbi:hypothetical protein [Ensifer adhaerens]|uniref:hypothetical protein n=1 Tax=Ensifer adhaerens TaxID=106592 RepID=UPI001C4E1DC9|nr:hypothetical protein [Ensifer adhaerens]MBW0368394.1 hypothetical protein [Ensifer adhaerens]UCM24996.1 hypothetical protein LDL63_34995 [Ensifer adhaerens]
MIEPPQGAEAQSRRASLEIAELRGNKTSTNLFSYAGRAAASALLERCLPRRFVAFLQVDGFADWGRRDRLYLFGQVRKLLRKVLELGRGVCPLGAIFDTAIVHALVLLSVGLGSSVYFHFCI